MGGAAGGVVLRDPVETRGAGAKRFLILLVYFKICLKFSIIVFFF